MRRIAALFTSVVIGLTVLAGCGDSDEPAPSSSDPLVITITVKGDTISPNGERLKVAVGQPIELDVSADAPGEVHVHSTPEQEFEYEAGTTKLTLTPISVPGVIDVESHTLDKTIVQLQAE